MQLKREEERRQCWAHEEEEWWERDGGTGGDLSPEVEGARALAEERAEGGSIIKLQCKEERQQRWVREADERREFEEEECACHAGEQPAQ